MPPNIMPHVVDRLTEIGLTGSNGMAAVPLSWGEINEWERSSTVRITGWEKRLIRALSVAYVAEGHRAESDTCPPPWLGEANEATKAAEVAALDLLF
ncbi:hypothetical protein GCM10011380_08880 [Sphingomonas metalli]|uniref:Uncharacterized protein n=1 Tax=Sphingomonas metalli TaxID=1779358 RepID=A0A916SY22_9SPHN|nr:hypothetical protein [Sphingomonas metalli]GGB21526.1 hypothetical protein GCM10011380_08880 [Sphingomonas metalli]